MDNKLNASEFTESVLFYEKEFENIFSGITYCYKLMVKDNIQVPANNENKIRDVLLSNYLQNQKIKDKVGLTNFRFDRETLENTTNGRVDIRILSKNDFNIDPAYYIIECKRIDNKNLNGKTGLNAKYIEEGIMRFVKTKYSAYYGLNGMIGFVVEKMSIAKNIENINILLRDNFLEANTKKEIIKTNFIKDFEYQYSSVHKTINKKLLKLYHLMFDFYNLIDPI